MRRVLSGLRRAREASVWGKSAISTKDARVDGLLRRNLPRFDIACILFGVFGFLGGIPALRDTFSEPYSRAWSTSLVVVALVCLIGVAYPEHLWRAEYVGKSLLIGLIIVYAVAVAIAGVVGGDLGRTAVGFAIYAMTELPSWRLRDIIRERGRNGWA